MTEHEQGVITPRRSRGDPQIPPDALVAIVRTDLDRITREISARRVSFSASHLFSLFEGALSGGGPFSVAGPFFGSPHAAAGIEKLIALGARRFWVLGWCGAIDPALSIGDMIVPSGAFSEEGTSRLYTGEQTPLTPHGGLTARLDAALDKRAIKPARGPVWTTDALYRETPSKIRAYGAMGALAVEMELSALLSVAVFRSVALAALLVVSDELSPAGWRPGFSNPQLKESCEVAGAVVTSLASGAGGIT